MKKVLEEEYVIQFINMQKLKTNIWKIMAKIENRHILNIEMSKIYMVGRKRVIHFNQINWII